MPTAPAPEARIHAITRPSPQLLKLYVVRCLLLACLGPWFLIGIVPLYFKYHTLRYRFDAEGIGMSWGILWRRETYLTYARIQDIHLSRGVVERWLGLATIGVQTAAGSAASEMSIVGLTEYEVLRDFLYGKMRGATHGAAEHPAPEDEAARLLAEIRDDLRAVRTALGRAK